MGEREETVAVGSHSGNGRLEGRGRSFETRSGPDRCQVESPAAGITDEECANQDVG